METSRSRSVVMFTLVSSPSLSPYRVSRGALVARTGKEIVPRAAEKIASGTADQIFEHSKPF